MAVKNLTPAQIAEKHIRRTTAATQDMINGVQNVTVSPTEQAAKKQDKLIQNWTESIQSGKWARGLRAVSLEDWKKAMTEKGAPRVAAGLNNARGKLEAFYAELLPFQADLQAKIQAMPDLTLEDSIARMTAQVRGMANFRKGKTR
jgi:hypothetical protein